MKICIVSLNLAAYYDPTPRSPYGGAEVQAAFVARALAATGQDVTLVVADHEPDIAPPYPTLAAFDSRAGVPGLRFFHPRMTGIMHALEEADADVYYQRNAGMVTGLTAHFSRRRGRVFVYGSGSDTDFSFRRVLIHGMRDRILYHYGIRGADGVVVQNDAQRRMAKPVLRGVVRTIPNGVMPAERTVARDDGAILWAGGVRRIKRPDLFIELARRLPDRKFILIGGGLSTEGDFAAGIETEARGVPNLTMTGWKPNSDVIRMVGDASLVVNTSEVEGFPNVYLEAWNHGVPVVSFSDVDGLIREKEIGAICTGIDDMETTIRGLLADGPRLHGMRERARRLATERYSPEALGPKYVAFFQELLDARRHAR